MSKRERVTVVETVDNFDKNTIDSIATNGFFTFEYLKALETSRAWKRKIFYIAVYLEDELVSFAPCFIDSLDEYMFLFGSKRIHKLFSRLGIIKNRVLVCYSPFSLQSQILAKKGESKSHIYGLVLNKIDIICKETNTVFSCFPYVAASELSLISFLKNRNYLKVQTENSFFLDIKWNSLEAYISSLKRNIRHEIRKELRKLSSSRVETEEVSDFESIAETLHFLSKNVFSKYGNLDSPYSSSFFRRLNEHAKGKIKLFVAKNDQEIIGFSFSLQHMGVVDCFASGFKYDDFKTKASVYFNIVYYLPIKWAIEQGIHKINYRIGADEAKRRRGCQSQEIFGLLKSQNSLIFLAIKVYLKINSMVNRRKTQPLAHTPSSKADPK